MYLSDTEKIGPSEGGSGTNVHMPSANDLRVLACPNTGITELSILCDNEEGSLTKGNCLKLYAADHIGKAKPIDLTIMLDMLMKKCGLQLN